MLTLLGLVVVFVLPSCSLFTTDTTPAVLATAAMENIGVGALDTITEIGDAIVAAFDLFLDAPFTLANAVGVVTATAENLGTVCNNWGIAVDGVIEDVTP